MHDFITYYTFFMYTIKCFNSGSLNCLCRFFAVNLTAELLSPNFPKFGSAMLGLHWFNLLRISVVTAYKLSWTCGFVQTLLIRTNGVRV